MDSHAIGTRSAFSMLLLVTVACASDAGASTEITERDSAGIRIVEHGTAALSETCAVDSVPSVRIGVAFGPEEYQFYRVFGATQLSDGRIVVVNQGSQEIRYYSPDGTFIRRSGRAGQGPGEFSDAFYIWQTRDDTVYVGDYDPWQFEVFSPEGDWVRMVQPEPVYANSPAVIAVLEDGRSVLATDPFPTSSGPGFELEHYTLVSHDAEGELRDTLMQLPNARRGQLDPSPQSMSMSPLFESYAQVSGGGPFLVVGHGSRPELQILSGDGSLAVRTILRWQSDDRTISAEAVDAARKRLSERYPDLDEASRKRFIDPLISTDRPVADSFPAFASLVVGRDGRIWVREYGRPLAPGGQHWFAFDSAGRFSCRATMPVDEEVLEFGADYVLMEDPDPDGVERVSRFDLGAPRRQ